MLVSILVSHASAEAEHDISSLSCVRMCVTKNRLYPKYQSKCSISNHNIITCRHNADKALLVGFQFAPFHITVTFSQSQYCSTLHICNTALYIYILSDTIDIIMMNQIDLHLIRKCVYS